MLIRLPSLCERAGRPAYALVAPAVEPPGFAEEIPPRGALLLLTAWPPAALMASTPRSIRGAPCYLETSADGQHGSDAEWFWWLGRVLQASLRPPMTPRALAALGPDRKSLALALLRVWNFLPEADETWPYLPSPAMQDILRQMAVKMRRAPSDLLGLPQGTLPSFLLDFRILLGTQGAAAAGGGIPPDMLES